MVLRDRGSERWRVLGLNFLELTAGHPPGVRAIFLSTPCPLFSSVLVSSLAAAYAATPPPAGRFLRAVRAVARSVLGNGPRLATHCNLRLFKGLYAKTPDGLQSARSGARGTASLFS